MKQLLKTYLCTATLFTLMLSGCSSIPNDDFKLTIKQSPQQRVASLQHLSQWQVTGKIAFIETNNRNSASLNWQVDENNNSQRLSLTSYLGINVLQLNSKGNNHTLKVDGKTYQGNDLAALTYSLTGLILPTKALSFWLKGIAYQESDIISYDEITQLPKTLSSHYNNELWQVSYSRYQQVANYSLATKISIKKEGLLIKIAINEWSINTKNN
ncbi:lipoprotein insertase outer membrane protein LolB [Colwellia piezophila]|uniref:lipoprotein insertase outer membrane protein LolB n=1 Tax=Colwellia piezophila TaxID=211668 RepID=UPI001FDF01FA|nr:lipoprotein insertase outer membrane protein LolB [Colwellia piezophila]